MLSHACSRAVGAGGSLEHADKNMMPIKAAAVAVRLICLP